MKLQTAQFLGISVILLTAIQAVAQPVASVLAQGEWAKVAVSEDGIYSLTAADLESLGLGTAPFVSTQLGLYGRTAGALPERNSSPREVDVQPVHILVDDGGDGVFSGADRIYFYGQSPHTWVYNDVTNRFDHWHHPYSDQQVYFVTTSEGGARIASAPSLTGPAAEAFRFTHVAHHEQELQNLVGSGRQWFGEHFDYTLTRQVDLGLDALDAQSTALFRARGVGRSTISGTTLELSSAQGPIGELYFGSIAASSGADYVDEAAMTQTQSAVSGTWGELTLTFKRDVNPSAAAWLDYVNVNADAPFEWRQRPQVWHFLPADTAVLQANLSQVTGGLTANGQAWNVSNPLQPQRLTPVGFTANGSAHWGLRVDGTVPQTIAVFETSTLTPALLGKVGNQNLQQSGPLDYVIVAPDFLLPQAQRLADFHTEKGLRVTAVDVQKIYNEFSSGVQDITAIKDYLRHLWDSADTATDRPKYLLLFGDASYDYRGVVEPNTNQVPIYQSYSSFSLYSSFSTDDFYGFMDADEGNNLRAKGLDLGIGRIPVNTEEEAKGVVDKILAYSDPVKSMGPWRKKVLFVSDDVDHGWEAVLTSIPNIIADRLDTVYPFLDIDKMYADSYEQQSSSASQSYPRLRTELVQSINDGNLVTAYVGHGGEVGWASENILQLNDTKTFSNGAKLPLFVTVTCEFSRLDDPLRTSAGEFLLLNPQGGAIALLSTTRVVYVDGAATLNDSIFRVIFEKEGGQYRTFGQILRSAKNGTTSSDKLRFSLLGDPALRLNIPEHRVVLDSLNALEILPATLASQSDTLQALSRVRIHGHVEDGFTNAPRSDFNGPMEVILYDKKVQRSTLKNDNEGPFIFFGEWANAAYRGKVFAQLGRFEAEWVMPLDIALQVGQGKFSFYAQTDSTDASGSDFRVWIGGIDPDAPVDVTGPTVEVFMGDTNFVSGGITGPSPLGLVRLFDENGINAVGNGIGHDLMGALDGNWNEAFSLNSRYSSLAGTFQRGEATWPFENLEEGAHTFSVRAWDSYNNVAEGSVDFTVFLRDQLKLGALRIYPNPGMGPFHLDVEHNAQGDSLEAVWTVVTPEGQIVYHHVWEGNATSAVLQSVDWDGTDGRGHLLPAGWYMARVHVRRKTDGQIVQAAERVILLH
jgi:hypothetical protein